MKVVKIVLILIAFYAVNLYITDTAFCRSASLTTTIIITVKEPPKSSVAESDRNAEVLNQLAANQSMLHPYISEAERMEEDIKFSGEKIYTLIDKL